MSTPDWFLVTWWLLAAAVGILVPILVRRSRTLDREAAVRSYLTGSQPRRYLTWPSPEMPRATQVALLGLIALLVVGAFALFLMEYWTRLLLLNAQIFLAIVGSGIAAAGLSAKMFAKVPPDWPRAITIFMRAGFVLFGVLLVAAGCITAIKDVASPRRVVEGHVDGVRTYSPRRRNTEYVVVIDGRRFISTFEAFVHIQPDRRVRVEVGAGSGVILAADDNALRPIIARPSRLQSQ